MDQAVVVNLIKDSLTVVLKVALPIMVIAMVVGIIIAVFQAATQINEQNMVLVPKIVVVFLGLIILGSWMISQLTEYTRQLFDQILSLI
ncbi:MAG: flagellar biosynthesis protein FliQ [Clostridia bacterium]|jgi:flagellar biosynthetic protein FliQ